jgi:hypothetical protein
MKTNEHTSDVQARKAYNSPSLVSQGSIVQQTLGPGGQHPEEDISGYSA